MYTYVWYIYIYIYTYTYIHTHHNRHAMEDAWFVAEYELGVFDGVSGARKSENMVCMYACVCVNVYVCIYVMFEIYMHCHSYNSGGPRNSFQRVYTCIYGIVPHILSRYTYTHVFFTYAYIHEYLHTYKLYCTAHYYMLAYTHIHAYI